MLRLKPAGTADLPFLSQLLVEANQDPERTLYYPRFENEAEMHAELKLWGASLEEVMRVVLADERPIGVAGFLASPGDEEAYLIGPLLEAEHHRSPRLKAAVELLLAEGRRFKALTGCLCEANRSLLKAYRELGWASRPGQLEMEWKRSENTPGEGAAVSLLTSDSGPKQAEVATVLGQALGWEQPEERLGTLIDEEYTVGYLERGGQVAAAAVWTFLEGTDFARLEYLGTAAAFRGQGLASSLMSFILWNHLPAAAESVFVSVERDNLQAQRLFQSHGFEMTHKAMMVSRP